MTLVIDASVALKWVLEERGSSEARQLLTANHLLAAPDLMWIECANVLWVKARKGQISASDARAALDAIDAAPVRALAGRPLARAAQAIAVELGQSAYDCLYLAAAIYERVPLVSADESFVRAVLSHPVYAASVIML